jgi:hypothetical protein
VKTFMFWARPALFVAFWIAVAALTLSQLALIGPSLRAAGARPWRAPVARQLSLARTQAAGGSRHDR